MSESFQTVEKSIRREIVERKSRFIATVVPVRSKEEATERLDAIRKEFWDATHNCYAYRLAPTGLEYRFSDDGEPSGSAGKPILFVLQQRDLANVLVVVTRYFGGTKLGVGGLVRAYTQATVAALDAATVAVSHPTEEVEVFTPYDDVHAVRQLVDRYAVRFEEEFRDVVRYRLSVRCDQVDEFSELISEASQGRAGMVKISGE
jgi:uncharacterized YigZ family protein